MKLSNETREVLKNFANINQNLLVKTGSGIATMSAMKNIVATTKVNESFDKDFAIYDLNEFLSALSLFEDPELSFGDLDVVIKNDQNNLRYMYSDSSMITTPKTDIKMPDAELTFDLTQDTFGSLQKAAAVLGVPDLVLTVDSNSTCRLQVTDRKNDTSNVYSVDIDCQTSLSEGTFSFKVENLKLLSGDYTVELSTKGISRFTHKSKDLVYFIALEV